jgi:RNA polymerase subunit RPABC4/transcription elongation factor Spt4
MDVIIIIALLVLILLVVAFRRPHPASPRGLAGLFARKCPHCRVLISSRASHCPHCGQATGWAQGAAMSAFDMECPHCHATVNRFTKCCRNCGADLDAHKTTPK